MDRYMSQSPQMTSTPQLSRNVKSIRDSFEGVSPILPNNPLKRNVKSMIPIAARDHKLLTSKMSLPATKMSLGNVLEKVEQGANLLKRRSEVLPPVTTNDIQIFKNPEKSCSTAQVWNQPPQSKRHLSLKRKSTLGRPKFRKTDIPPPQLAKEDSLFEDQGNCLNEENELSPLDVFIPQKKRKTYVVLNDSNKINQAGPSTATLSSKNVVENNISQAKEASEEALVLPSNQQDKESEQTNRGKHTLSSKKENCSSYTKMPLNNVETKDNSENINVESIEIKEVSDTESTNANVKLSINENNSNSNAKHSIKENTSKAKRETVCETKELKTQILLDESDHQDPVEARTVTKKRTQANAKEQASNVQGEVPVKRSRRAKEDSKEIIQKETTVTKIGKKGKEETPQINKVDVPPRRGRRPTAVLQESKDEDETVPKRARRSKAVPQENKEKPTADNTHKRGLSESEQVRQKDEDETVTKRARRSKAVPQENKEKPTADNTRKRGILESEQVSQKDEAVKPTRGRKPKEVPQESKDEALKPTRGGKSKLVPQDSKESTATTTRGRRGKDESQEINNKEDAVTKRVRSKGMPQKGGRTVANKGRKQNDDSQESNKKGETVTKRARSKKVLLEDEEIDHDRSDRVKNDSQQHQKDVKRNKTKSEKTSKVELTSDVTHNEDFKGCFGIKKAECSVNNGVLIKKLVHVDSYLLTGYMKLKTGVSITKATTTTVYFVEKGVAQVRIKDVNKRISADSEINSFYIPKCCDFTIKNEDSSTLKMSFTKFKD